jgi:two-component system LytT family response regulator
MKDMIRTLIVDDEAASIAFIKTLIESLAKDLEVVGTATNGYEAIQQIMEQKPQLVFLDVDMPGMNGLEVLKKIPQRDFEVIFITGYSEFALQAIKLRAADYLLKSIEPGDFIMAVAHAREQIRLRQQQRQEGAEADIPMVRFPTKNGFIYVDRNEIEYADGMGSYSNIHKANGERITVIRSIGQLKEKLTTGNFFRCHNSHLINLDFVTEFLRKDAYYVVMKSGAQVEVSRRNKDQLLEELSRRSG